jgi:hypothetical protein
MPSMGSYLLENMILDYYENSNVEISQFVDIEIIRVLGDIKSRVYQTINDPKNMQGNINNLNAGDKLKISNRATSDYNKALEARQLEVEEKYKESINKWREIFGDDFPIYE